MSPNTNGGTTNCDLTSFERINHFDGMLLTARDMRAEQRYHRDRLSTVAQHVLGEGTVCGLEAQVTTTTTAEGEQALAVSIKKGFGLDSCGNFVVVKDDTNRHLKLADATLETDGDGLSRVHLALRYDECSKELVPMLGGEDACEEQCCYSRVLERFDVVSVDYPGPKPVRPVEFPSQSRVNSTPGAHLDALLSGIATSYHRRRTTESSSVENGDGDGGSSGTGAGAPVDEFPSRIGCSVGENPLVYLGSFRETDGDAWDPLPAPNRLVYTNDMLFAGLARHAIRFDNPHQVSLTVARANEADPDAGALLRTQDDQSDHANVLLYSSDENISVTASQGVNRQIALAIPGYDTLVERVDTLTERLPLLERYVMDKAMKYKLDAYGHLRDVYEGQLVAAVADRVVERTTNALLDDQRGIRDAAYLDPNTFRAFIHDPGNRQSFTLNADAASDDGGVITLTQSDRTFTVDRGDHGFEVQNVTDDGQFTVNATLFELERLSVDLVAGLADPRRVKEYRQALVALGQVLTPEAADESVDALAVAVEQDQVCETAERLAPLEDDEVVPLVVFLGEEGVDLTATGSIDADDETFIGIAGEADGGTATVADAENADVSDTNNFSVGEYTLPGDDDVVLIVLQPVVDLVTLELEGADITDERVRAGIETPLTVRANFNFDGTDVVAVAFGDSDRRAVSPPLLSDADEITEDGGALRFDISDLQADEYTVTASAKNELSASASASFTLFELGVSLEVPDTVELGDPLNVDVSTNRGGIGFLLAMERESLASTQRFLRERPLVTRNGKPVKLGTTGSRVTARLTTDENGTVDVVIDTRLLTEGSHELFVMDGETDLTSAEFEVVSRGRVDLVDLIGRTRMERFHEAGVVRPEDILALDTNEIVSIADVTPEEAVRIRESAHEVNATLVEQPERRFDGRFDVFDFGRPR